MEKTALLNSLPQVGKIEWIGLRPSSKEEMQVVSSVEVSLEEGLVGDRYASKSKKRQVTLIQKEHLEAVSSLLDKAVTPSSCRRNILISGINLLAFKDRQFKIGEVILEMTGLCHPCSKMERNLGPGGYNAMRGHGGITARVIKAGIIELGQSVILRKEE
ncbi:MAG: MOSC domain-containing protein [Saprospiraceae bacterium]